MDGENMYATYLSVASTLQVHLQTPPHLETCQAGKAYFLVEFPLPPP